MFYWSGAPSLTRKFSGNFFLLTVIFCCLDCGKDKNVSTTEQTLQPAYGGVLRIVAQSPESLDPIHSKNYWESEIVLQLFDGLLRFDQNLNVVPALAQNWQIAPDGRVYTFQLRSGARFHKGREVNADDFVYSLTRLLDPKSKSVDTENYSMILGANEYQAGQASFIRGLRAIDPLTLQITLKQPYAPFLRVLAQQPASVVPKEEVERSGVDFGKRPVGTGAFRLRQWNTPGEIFLVSNPDYFEGPPYLEGIHIKTVPALNARDSFKDFLEGKLEMSFVPSDQIQMAQSRKEWAFLSRPILRFMYLGINLKDPLMKDIDVRKAIHFAINKAEVMGNEPDYSITNSLIPISLLGSNPAANEDVYNVKAAQEALKSSRSCRGRPPRVKLWHATASVERKGLLTRLANNLKAIGIQVDLKILSSLNELNQKIYSGQTQLFLLGEVIDFPDPDAILNRLFNSRSKGNLFAYRNGEVDRKLREAQTSMNEDLRAQLYRQIEHQILEDHVIIPLFLAKYSFVSYKRVQGIEVSPLGFQYFPIRKVWLQHLE